MPITYNGVGTRYHGRANLEKRVAACHSCGRTVSLESYDTRLWFVVLFVPVIPLGRKRIVDECSVCRRHYVVNADEWETRKQLSVSGAMGTYLADPTPENAMEAHQQLMNFHQAKEAGEFRREIAEKFAQNAKLQAYLGESLTGKGQAPDAAIYYERALALRPDLPVARVGVAREHIRHGRLGEARALLDFLEKPGASQLYSLEPLEILAYAYMNAGKREEALELFQRLLAEIPAVAQFPRFRKSVQTCEKILGRKPGMLPKRKFSWKGLLAGGWPKQPGSFRLTWRGVAITGLVALIFLAVMVLQNFYLSRHRSLYIVNGFTKAATVEVRGVGTVHVGSNAEELIVPEGRHHALISGPLRKELDFDMQSGFWDRWSLGSVWMLNIAGAALVTEDHVTYRQSDAPPATVLAHFGSEIERIDHVDHPFTALPPTLTLDHDTERTLVDLNIFREPPSGLMGYFQVQGRTSEAAALAEWRIKFHPEDEEALSVFVSLADKKHAEEVLRSGLGRRPVEIQWHRFYQSLGRTHQWETRVALEYDAMLKVDPTNSALLYLRGRVAADPSEAEQYFTRAREADPKNPFPIFALGYHRSSAGDWEKARLLYASALELKPDSGAFKEAFFYSRLALEEYDPLEKELRAEIVKHPLDYSANSHLLDVLLAQQRTTAASNALATYQKQEQTAGVTPQLSAVSLLYRQFYYLACDFEQLRKVSANDRTPAGRAALFSALIEQGKVAEAVRIHPLNDPGMTDPWHFITVSLAWLAAHDQEQANAWLSRGIQLLGAGAKDEVRAAALFQNGASLSPANLDAVDVDPKAKAILLAALGVMHEEQRNELFAAARRCNVDRSFPFELVRRITAGHWPLP